MKLEPSVYKQLGKKHTDHRVENLQLLWHNLHYEKFKTDILGYGQCYKTGILCCVLQAHLKCAIPRHDENTNYNQESNPSRKLVWKTSLNVLLQTKPSCVLTLLSRCRERLMQKIKGDMAFREGEKNKRLCKYDPWCFSCASTHKEKPQQIPSLQSYPEHRLPPYRSVPGVVFPLSHSQAKPHTDQHR